MEYRLLGPVEARRDGEVLSLGRKPRALLALLLINANQVVSTDRIIDELWGDDPGRDPQNALWVVISRLRSVLEPDREKRSDGSILLTQMPGYRLVADPSSIDASRFVELVAQGRGFLAEDPERAADTLRDALAMWQGHALEEFTYEPFAIGEIRRLEELRLAAVEDRVDADLRLGRAQELVGELEARVQENPFRQRLVGQLMLSLHLSGRQGEALRAFSNFTKLLVEEQGLDPSTDLVRLEEQILLDDPELRPVVPSTEGPGLSVRGYEIRDQIGSGSMGNVYRAFQPAVGREVAIKVIRPELANDPDFIRRFEVEAKAIAQIEHPQIVPVFDFWREPDSAYLVMRHFEHGSLMAAVEDAPLSVDRALSILEQIGGALSAAHRRSAAHGDLKPENVLLDNDGNAYLSDFGMSVTPIADEGDAFEAPSEQSDTVRFAALSEFVFRNTVEDDKPGESPLGGPAIDVIDRACNYGEFSTVATFLVALREALGNRPAVQTPDTDDAINPYQGLRAFGEDDAGRFYGRERLVDRLLTRLGDTGPQGQFVAVVGPSGSGKSSVVRAGVVPALRRGAVLTSESWFVVTMTPGRRPFESLAGSLRSIAVNPPAELASRLEADGIARTIERVSADPAAQVVLVVDQFEELFTQSEDAKTFLDALVKVANDRHSGVKVIATMRADFYDRPLQHSDLGELLRLGTEVITPMTPEELERAITQPAHDAGVAFEPGAVARITADMAGQSAALPLMQHALTELFDGRSGSTITADSYLQLGGVSGALARRADALYDDLGSPAQHAVREIFLRLVTVQEGSADTRRRARTTELTDAAGPESASLLESFGKHRLLSFDQDPVTRTPTAEIAHEALLTSWDRLRGWIDEARASLLAQRRLAITAAEWTEQGESPDAVLTGSRLRSYDGWLEQPPVRLTERERALLVASEDFLEAELVTERKRVSRLRRLVGVAGGAFVIAAIAAGIALWQQNKAADAAEVAEAQTLVAQEQTQVAEEQRSLAQDQTMVAEEQTAAAQVAATTADLERIRAQAVAELEGNPPLAALLAVEAYNIDGSVQSAGSIHRVLTGVDGQVTTMLDTQADYGGPAVLSRDGSIYSASSAGAIDVWHLDDRELLLRHEVEFARYDMDLDASLIAVGADANTKVELVEVPSGEILGAIDSILCKPVDISPDGNQVAVISDTDGNGCDFFSVRTLEIWDVTDPTKPSLEHSNVTSNVWGISFSPDGEQYVTVGLGGLVEGWDAETHEAVWQQQLELGEGEFSDPVISLFRSDSSAVVVGVLFNRTSGISLITFDAQTGEQLYEPTSSAGLGSLTWFDKEETQIAGTFWPSGIGVYDLPNAAEILPVPLDDRNAANLHIDHERERIITSSFVGVTIRSLDGLSVLETRVSLTPEQLAVKADADGQTFASLNPDGTKLLMSTLDFAGRAPVVEWDMTTDPPTKVRELPSGITFVNGDVTGVFGFDSVTLLDENFEPLAEPILTQSDRGPLIIWRASGDGSRQAGQRLDASSLELYDTSTGEQFADLTVPNATYVYEFSFNYDGTRLIADFETTEGSRWALFDTTNGEVLRIEGEGDSRIIRPWLSGNTLYIEGENFAFRRLDIDTFEEIGPPLVGHTLLINALDDDPDGDLIATQATNGTVRVWDRESGDQVGREIAIGRQSSGTYVDTSLDGKIVSVILDTELGIWNYDIDTWPAFACDLAGRNMTQREWDDFGPANEPYRATCPQFPANN